ncbi:MAG: glycoside hydrolase family 3 C-terminal domain-containing protein [Melioribacteraceae bacterium]|nr:glycoside hydrolase family 3 C-terminal domain-containing protein [Melioribacteraceae bacterium]MCF8355421.1 glycoside hydrolase family 3 C-terminal domain-containing protein [Melioribacteraceae bacterium]MCF8393263.1 glycoside hydrolase family 3 C-terminal domain-containing protein [Melioribacteraceae bacterium]MCF8417564.1 glycoside hydrolase family 3 C-terminal domain-containing protein [Melioribacteraceae bacterium]
MKNHIIIYFAAVLFVFTSSLIAQENKENRFVDSLLNRMTLEEKIGQLVELVTPNSVTEKMLSNGNVSSILGIKDADIANELQHIAVEESRLGIPLLFTNDVIHGYNTTFPIPLAEASSWNPGLIEEACRIAAIEAASNGTHLTFAPMVDIARDPRWGRIAEGSGEDVYLGSVIAEARIKGFQGNDLKSKSSIGACAKHFVAYGAAEGGKDYNTVDISERTLREIYLPPFKASVDVGVVSIMSAFNDLNGIPASANYFTLTEILRNEWNFDGLVISDYNSIPELVKHRFARNKAEAAAKALTAGVDMDMAGDDMKWSVYAPHLDSLIKNKIISEKILNESVRRVLRVKHRLGLFENPYVDKDFYKSNMPSFSERKNTALRLARESIVLLKNENNLLPLKKHLQKITVIGELADNPHHPLGPWNTAPILENVVTPLDGIKNYASKKTEVEFIKGCNVEGNDRAEFDRAITAAKSSDVVIMVIGETREMSGEAASRTNIDIPGVQLDLVKEIIKTGTPVVVVLMNGRPLTIPWLDENVPAVLETWFLGDQTGNALAQVLFGDYNPSGKLPVTFPRNVGQIPIYYSHKSTGRPFNGNDKYTAKYLDVDITPLYPFGYGLSYTDFEYSEITTSKRNYNSDEIIEVSVTVRNTGLIDGEEVIQLYITDKFASITRPVKELKDFTKVLIKPGETKKIKFVITPDKLSFYNIDMDKLVEPGEFTISIGGNSRDVISKSIIIND